jgi:hypothetical protein
MGQRRIRLRYGFKAMPQSAFKASQEEHERDIIKPA